MKEFTNTNAKRFISNRLFSIVFLLFGGGMAYFSKTLWASSTISGVVGLCSAVVFVIIAMVITLNLSHANRVAKILNGHSSMSVDEFAKEAQTDTYLALKMLNAAFNGQYVVGYVDSDGEMIILKNCSAFNAKRYREYLTNGK